MAGSPDRVFQPIDTANRAEQTLTSSNVSGDLSHKSVGMADSQPPVPLSARFTLELEFVLCLANPYYLNYLAATCSHLLNKPADTTLEDDTDAAKFARYLKYLYDYWKTPKYSQFLTHPGAALRNLELLQQEQFRKDIIRPDTIERLLQTLPGAEEQQVAPEVQPQVEVMDVTAG